MGNIDNITDSTLDPAGRMLGDVLRLEYTARVFQLTDEIRKVIAAPSRTSKRFGSLLRYYEEYIGDLGRLESQWVRRHICEVSGRRILNVGCGPQLYDDAAEFPVVPAEVVGVDVNETNIEFLKTSEHPHLLKSKMLMPSYLIVPNVTGVAASGCI